MCPGRDSNPHEHKALQILSLLWLPFHHPGNIFLRGDYSNIKWYFYPTKMLRLFLEMQAGVEPANGGFANHSVRPLRHCILFFI
jgi:hypothetical protein